MRSRIGMVVALGTLLLVASAGEAAADRRVALVIGNSGYKYAPTLPNPINDASAVGIVLKQIGFEVVEARDLGNAEMRRALRDFTDRTSNADIALVYFAGHGIEVGGSNYLVPVDARLERDIDAEDEAVALDRVLKMVEPAKRLRLVVLDACRENPFVRSMKRQSGTRALNIGLAPIEPTGSETLVAFAAKAGSTATDGQDVHSPFTKALLNHIILPGLDVRLVLGRVRDDVRRDTSGRQEPFVYGSLGGSVVSLAPEGGVAVAPRGGTGVNSRDALRDYELAVKAGRKDVWDAFLLAHAASPLAALAREHRDRLVAAAPAADPIEPAAAPAKLPAVASIDPGAPAARTVRPRENVKREPVKRETVKRETVKREKRETVKREIVKRETVKREPAEPKKRVREHEPRRRVAGDGEGGGSGGGGGSGVCGIPAVMPTAILGVIGGGRRSCR